MKDWKVVLHADPTDWLLEESDPSARYFTLRWLLDKSESDPEVVVAQEAIRTYEPVVKLLNAQRPDGRWRRERKEPYQSIHYFLMALEHFEPPPGDERMERAIEYQFEKAQLEDGAFTASPFHEDPRREVIPCYAARALVYLYKFGYGDDPRAQKILDYLLADQLEEGGWLCHERVKKTHSCFYATAKAVRALQFLPPDGQSPQVKEAIRLGVELFLNSGLYKHHSEFGKRSPNWFKFGYPLTYGTDLLEVLELVAPYVSPDDERIQEGLEMVLSRQDERGRWPQEKTMERLGRHLPIEFEPTGQPGKHVTLHALRMLKRLYE